MKFRPVFFLPILVFLFQCTPKKVSITVPKVVYRSQLLVITQISPRTYVHTSFLQTQDFGRVACNGLVVVDGGEAVVLDTPTSDAGADALIRWLEAKKHCHIKAVVPTHFHDDCLGGLQAFHKRQLISYANAMTVQLAKERDYTVPQQAFADSLEIPVGTTLVTLRFFGEGHTRDNVVGYIPSENVLFGGCLVKEVGAGKGYLGDANVQAWSATVGEIRKAYPQLQTVVPGHGAFGGTELLDYTIKLFQSEKQ